MKVAVYEESPIPGDKDHFVEIFDCPGIEEIIDPENETFSFDEDGKCPYNQDCRDEINVLYDGYASTRKYCISLDENGKRQGLTDKVVLLESIIKYRKRST